MDTHGYQWISLEVYENSLIAIGIFGYAWISMGVLAYPRYPWTSLDWGSLGESSSLWFHFRVSAGSLGYLGITLGTLRAHSRINLGSLSCHSGIHLGSPGINQGSI